MNKQPIRIYSYVLAGMALCACQGVAHAQWVVQLQSGTMSALLQEQKALTASQVPAIIVAIEGQQKLVVPFADKGAALLALRRMQSQHPSAFVRQLPEVEGVASVKTAPKVTAPAPLEASTASVIQTAKQESKVLPKLVAPAKPTIAMNDRSKVAMNASPIVTTPAASIVIAPTLAPKSAPDYSKLIVSNRLPGPIVPDEPHTHAPTVKQEISVKAKPTMAPERMVAVTEFWAVQLGAGHKETLIGQAKTLVSRWADARVIEIDGKAKLVVGHFQSPGEAASSLLSLKQVNAQAFVRKITDEVVLFVPEQVVVAPKTMTETKKNTQVQQSAIVQPKVVEVLSPSISVVPPSTTEPSDVLNDEKLDSLPAIVAVAAPIQEVPSVVVMLVTPEEQAMRDAADLVDGEATQDRGNHWWRREAPVEAPDMTVPELVEKRNIELPMREKPVEMVTRRHSVDHVPVDLMLSPLYLLPQDAAKAKETDMTMASLSRVLQDSSLAKLIKDREMPADVADKQQLMNRIAEHANAKEWLKALPLAKAAESIDVKQLTSTDHLMLGWVWLQNQLPEKAKKYFTYSIKARAQDEARYGLALSYVMMNEKRAAFNVYQQMAPSPQKTHLKTML